MSKVKRLPPRRRVKAADTWDLSSLYGSDSEWFQDLKRFEKCVAGYDKFRGTLGNSTKALAKCLKFDSDSDRLADRWASMRF